MTNRQGNNNSISEISPHTSLEGDFLKKPREKGEDVEKRETRSHVRRNVNWFLHQEKCYAFSSRIYF